MALQKKYLPKGWEAWNNLQTNGLLISRQWAEFLKDNRFDVGLSIDGDALTHDRNRVDRGGQGSYARVSRAIGTLQAAGVQPDLLCTVNAETVRRPLEVYQALRSFDTGWVQFIPVVVRRSDGSVDPISVTPDGYGAFFVRRV